ncbi:MAG TPA: PHP domain-containing protein [Acidimicrobiales bacterium]|nr:PHP domain-containing protein [Acidimicrobiales bacterium]
MSPPFPLLDAASDLHVHSTWSDGASTVEENLAAARARGLHTLGMVDHVRRATTYVPDFAAAVRDLAGAARRQGVRVLLGVEAKVLDTAGAVDLPASPLPELDYVLVADHQLPRPEGPLPPHRARAALERGELSAAEVVEDLVEATVAALGCWERVVVAHPFSILPKCGLGEEDVPDRLVDRLGDAARAADAVVEVNEKWACPSRRVAERLARRGVGITLSTDAHHRDRVGRYRYVTGVADTVRAGAGAGGATGS